MISPYPWPLSFSRGMAPYLLSLLASASMPCRGVGQEMRAQHPFRLFEVSPAICPHSYSCQALRAFHILTLSSHVSFSNRYIFFGAIDLFRYVFRHMDRICCRAYAQLLFFLDEVINLCCMKCVGLVRERQLPFWSAAFHHSIEMINRLLVRSPGSVVRDDWGG